MAGRDLSAQLFAPTEEPTQGRNFAKELFGEPQKQQPTESGGFFGSLGTALKERAETALPAAKIYTGLGDQQKATDELLKAKERSQEAYKQTEFGEIGDAFKAGRYGDALGKTIDKFKEVAGSSLGSGAAAMGAGAAGAAAAAAGAVALPAAAVGTAAFGVVALGSYIADNIGRQKEELEKEGDKYKDVNRLSATTAGAAQTALDIFGFRFFKPLGALVGVEGKATAQQAAMEIVEAATKPKAYARAVASGAAKGVAFEVPQEVAQQVLERWQAGLPLDPFTDPEAAREYMEAAGGAMLLGGPMGSYSSAMETRRARATPEGQNLLKGVNAGSALDTTGQEPEDVTRTIEPTSGESAQVVGEPAGGVPAGRVAGADTGRVVPPRQDVAAIDEGEGQQPSALTAEAAPQQEVAFEEKQAPTLTPEKTPTGPKLSADDFRSAYQELRQEALELRSREDFSDADARRLRTIQRNLNEVVEDNAGLIKDPLVIQQLKNPMYDGLPVIDALANQAVGQARGMQGDMFKAADRRTDIAGALEGKAPEDLLRGLNNDRERIQRRYDTGQLDSTWAMRLAEQFGFTRAQALQNPELVAQAYMKKAFADIDQATANLERHVGKSRGMQGDLFGNKREYGEKESTLPLENQAEFDAYRAAKERAAGESVAPTPEGAELPGMETGELEQKKSLKFERAGGPKETEDLSEAIEQANKLRRELEDTGIAGEFGAEEKETRRPVYDEEGERIAYDQKGRPIRAPSKEEAKEHVAETPEGQKIKRFFDAIETQADDAEEQKRQRESRNVAAKTLLEYDIAGPNEESPAGIKQMLDYLARRVGGMEKLDALLAKIEGATADSQSYYFERAGLPDLTTRRGMDKFRDEVKAYESRFKETAGGVQIPTKQIASKITKTPIPYREEVTYIGSIAQPRGPSPEGKPRSPSIVNVEKKYVIQDSKVRTAIRNLKQKLGAKGKLTAQEQATISYLNNPMRETFGEALTSLAYDVAYYEHDSDNHGANTLFYGEGGKYATAFKDWVEANLDQTTIDTLNNLIADHKSTIAENEKYVVEKRKTTVAKREYSKQQAAAEAEAARYDKEKKKERKKLTKEGLTTVAEEEDYEHNLPRKEMMAEIHPMLRGLLADGKTQEVLEILAQSKGNKYYAALAQRLIEANLTAKTRLIDTNVIEPLNNTPEVRESLDSRISVMSDIVRTLYPAEQQQAIIDGLRSKKLKELIGTAQSLRESLPKNNAAPAQMETVDSLIKLLEDEYGWVGKYDPKTDEIILRSGGGYLTNHLFLHEVLHAATSNLIDNADKLSGIQRQGYDRLVELYNYAKPILTDPAYGYAFSDLHEFVSESMTNPDLQLELRKLGYKASKLSLWNTFTEAVRKLFKVTKGDSNVLVETMLATDALIAGPMNLDGLQVSTAKGMAKGKAPKAKVMRAGMPTQPSTVQRWLQTRTWNEARREFSSLAATVRPAALGALTLRQIADLVRGRITHVDNFVRVAEDFLAHKNGIVDESAKIAKRWERLQSKDPELSRRLGEVMAMATIKEVDPDKATTNQRNAEQELMNKWRALPDNARDIYRDVRDFYEDRYSEYKRLMNQRVITMRKLGVSEATVTEIRNEFEKAKRKGPYFPLMRFGRFWYQIGRGTSREYYMFDSQAARDVHMEERIKQDPHLRDTIGDNVGNDYKSQMDFHARESKFLKETFAAIDNAAMGDKQTLKDTIYQTYLMNQPDRSMRNQFIHRQNIAGYSEDALRSFAASSFNMAYQMARFRYSPEMFSQMTAARAQIDRRLDESGYNPELIRENDELTDYVNEVEERLRLMLNPPDVGRLPQLLSNAGFIWYLTAPASAIVNVLGGMMVGLPTLIGQQVKSNPNMSYTTATLNALSQMKTAAGQIMLTGFQVTKADKVIDTELDFPSMDRSNKLTNIERAAYNRFVADGLIDITATYDQSGLAEQPTTSYTGVGHRTMVILTKLFHNAERFNREVMAMSAFRSAMEKYKGQNLSDRAAFSKAIAEAKDITNRSMFDYSSANKPRYFQHPIARVVTQFKQFPQQMTYFLCQNLYNSLKNPTEEQTAGMNPTEKKKFLEDHAAMKREARARFVGTMGMAAIFSGVTGIWGFSTVASIANAVFNGLGDEEEEPFDFELEFVNWANETFGANIGTLLARGAGNAAGIDLASRVKLDDMWFRDGRKNQDATASWKDKIVELLGPSVGLTINVTDAMDLYSKGHGDRAIEKVLPAFAKNPMVAARYANEGVRNMAHDPLIENVGAFDLLMQSLGIRSAELAERQFYNITKKGQEQGILKQRQNLLNLYGLTFMSGDIDRNMETFEAMMKFSQKHPTLAIDGDVLVDSITNRLNKSAQSDHGLYIDPKLQQLLNEGYRNTISNKGRVIEGLFD